MGRAPVRLAWSGSGTTSSSALTIWRVESAWWMSRCGPAGVSRRAPLPVSSTSWAPGLANSRSIRTSSFAISALQGIDAGDESLVDETDGVAVAVQRQELPVVVEKVDEARPVGRAHVANVTP